MKMVAFHKERRRVQEVQRVIAEHEAKGLDPDILLRIAGMALSKAARKRVRRLTGGVPHL
jgi:hypothetical protein